MYINIHTHCPQPTDEWYVQNLYQHFNESISEKLYSAGLHPWYVDENWETAFHTLQQFALSKNVIAIGECGLDKLTSTDFNLQKKIFVRHIHLANELNKPLILHCVRAYDEMLVLLKMEKNKVPVIFHGFNRSITIAQKIIDAGHYLSFGVTLQKQQVKECLKQIPPSQFFLETDDATIHIQQVYQLAAEALQIDKDSVSLQVFKNAANVFGAEVLKL